LAAALVVALAGCSAGGAHPAVGGASAVHGGGAHAASGGASPAAGPRPAAVTAVAGAPGCSTAVAPAPALRTVPTPMTSVPATPFGVTVTRDGRWAFVALAGLASVGVFRIAGPAVPSLVRWVNIGQEPVGETLTPDGRYLLAADDGNGAAVISVSRAESGANRALLGTLGGGSAGGAIEVAVSPDGRFAFVSLEDNATIAVHNLARALSAGLRASDLVGMIPTGIAPVGLAVSPDGRWLYATSELERGASARAQAGQGPGGTLTVINLARAETDPAHSVVSTVEAGCSPVRVVTSADGSVVWVTARGSDRLLGFSAARLRADPARSLVASVAVGEAPVGLALVGGGTRIVVADSNRFGASGAASSLAVIGVAAAMAGRPALLGYLRAGGFPREMALEPGGRTLLVGNFASRQLEAVDVADLP
jgi:DNA-binding beta-propeller fold protein YncE